MHKEHVQLLQHFFASLQNHPLLAISESSDAASCLQRGQATCWKAKYLRWSKLYPLTGRCKSTKGELYLRVGVFKAKKLWENLGKTSHPWVDLAPWQLCHEGDPPLEEKKLMETEAVCISNWSVPNTSGASSVQVPCPFWILSTCMLTFWYMFLAMFLITMHHQFGDWKWKPPTHTSTYTVHTIRLHRGQDTFLPHLP